MERKIRNIAIIAHVDHGKTTLVDQLLKQSDTLDERTIIPDRVMDSNDIEKERGITILAKNTAINWQDYHINIIDTPGHADFGGEVERILSMVDSVLLIVDAVDGPMPQTRFVTQKAFDQGLSPILVINKIDRNGARPDWAVDQVFDLFDNLGANDQQLDFPVIYASALNGFASLDLNKKTDNMHELFEFIVKNVPSPKVDESGELQLQISALDYSSYIGAIGIGKINRGKISQKMPVKIIDVEGKQRSAKITQLFAFKGLEKVTVDHAIAGDIVAIAGIDPISISDTICSPEKVEALPALTVDEPTLSMTFQINDSPFAGKDGKFITTRKIQERLDTELKHNVALKVETLSSDQFKVSGRGELHLAILIENMRREGYELAISRPEVIRKNVNGQIQEPFEQLTIDIEINHQGSIMELLGARKAELKNMLPDSNGRVRLDYEIATRGLIGFHSEFLTLTSGSGLIYHVFSHYGKELSDKFNTRRNGVLISNCAGKARAYALWNIQERGKLFIGSQTEVYEGMIVGIHSRDNDLIVNVTKEKQLTNIRASGTDENIILVPAIKMPLEEAMTFIADDELLEVTPNNIRLRKKFLKEHERKKSNKVR